MIQGSNFGPEFADAYFRSTRVHAGNRAAFSACEDLAAGRLQGVVIFGLVGTGKTHHLVCAAREFEDRVWMERRFPESGEAAGELVKVDVKQLMAEAAKRYAEIDPASEPAPTLTREEMTNLADVRFWFVPELAETLRSEISEGVRWTAEKCKECDLLVLDDLGSERTTDFVLEALEQIIDYRYRQHLPIAVSTNLRWPGAVRDRYGDRAVSRWSQHCAVVEMTGPDQRVRGGEESP